MTARKKSPLLLSTLIAGAALLTIALVFFFDTETESVAVVSPPVSEVSGSSEAAGTGTIAAAWQWEEGQGTNDAPAIENGLTPPQDASMPFTTESVYEALQAVKLDANGDVIADHDALLALDATLRAGDISLSPAQITALQDLIRDRLPGKAGEQTARIVGDYAEFIKAETEFNELYGSENGAYVADAGNLGVDEYEVQYQELRALREIYLGNEVAGSLFATQDANARYMFESQRIEQDAALSLEEKQQRAAALEAQHIEETTGIMDWNQRYNNFMTEKQRVVKAGLSDDEKRAQVAALMRQHFDSQELEKVSHLPLGDVTEIN